MFNTKDYHTNWDNDYYKDAAYIEWNISANVIYVTLKVIKSTRDLVDAVSAASEDGSFNKYEGNSTWWHILDYQIDFEKIVDSDDRVAEIKEQIIKTNELIKQALLKLK